MTLVLSLPPLSLVLILCNLQQIVDQAVFNLSLFSFKDCQRGRLSATVTEGWQAFYYSSRYYVLLVVEWSAQGGQLLGTLGTWYNKMGNI